MRRDRRVPEVLLQRPDDAFMLQLVDMVEGKSKAKRKSGVGILSILAKQYLSLQ